MRYVFLLLVLPCICLQAQDSDTTDRYVRLNEVVVSANKFRENTRNVIQKIDVVSARTIARTNAQNTGDLLQSTGKVFVQKSQQGGSSPVIRGFEASRILLVIDGVRMNNAIYRSGHLQNVITADQHMLDRVEVLQGPSSTLFGSDALGGTIHLITRQPVLSADKPTGNGNAFARYSTINNERTTHADINIGTKKWAFLTSATYSDFGDMRMGSRDHRNYPGFGRRNQYTIPLGLYANDTVVQNPDNRIQRYSGYRQWDILQKVLYQPSDKVSHLLNLQHSNSSNVPRYDRLQDIRNGTLRFAEWYYGPQQRTLAAYTLQVKKLKGFFTDIRVTLSYQDILETRQTREYRRYDRFDSRREQVDVWGAVIDLHKAFGKNELSTGFDAQWNTVVSRADRTNLLTGSKTNLDTRYPDGHNRMDNYGLFAQHILKFGGNKWVLNDGLRLQYVSLSSSIRDNSFFRLPVTSVVQQHLALTGNAGIAYIPSASDRLSLGIATGFRAPNIDDLSKVFESSTAAQQVVLPNSDIKPEYTYSIDVNYRKILSKKISIEAGAFYTLFRNAIVKAPFRLNGQDSILYDGVKAQILASQNQNRAFLYGGQLSVSADLNDHWSIQSTLQYTFGQFLVDPQKRTTVFRKQPNGSYALVSISTSRKPLDHIPPVFGKTSVRYRWKKGYAEAFSLYNGHKWLHRYNPDGEDNAQYATPDGMPGWITINIRLGWQLSKKWMLQAAAENLTDQNYRTFSSGFSAPGRNVLFSIRRSW